MQITPLPIHPGPLSGCVVKGLRSSLHHSYALTDDGRVFRWGWRGIVEPYDPQHLLAEAGGPLAVGEASVRGEPLSGVHELAFGYCSGVALL